MKLFYLFAICFGFFLILACTGSHKPAQAGAGRFPQTITPSQSPCAQPSSPLRPGNRAPPQSPVPPNWCSPPHRSIANEASSALSPVPGAAAFAP